MIQGSRQWNTGEELAQMLKEGSSLKTRLNIQKSIYQELVNLAIHCLHQKAEMRPNSVDVVRELLRISTQYGIGNLQELWEELVEFR